MKIYDLNIFKKNTRTRDLRTFTEIDDSYFPSDFKQFTLSSKHALNSKHKIFSRWLLENKPKVQKIIKKKSLLNLCFTNYMLFTPYSKTYITYKITYSAFHSRSMFKKANKVLVDQVALDKHKMFTNKVILFKYCEHFKNLSLNELLNDTLFFKYMHGTIHSSPTLHSRAFQLALEITYSKRLFSEKQLQEFYKCDFQVKDVLNINNGYCDQSTIYSSMLAKIVVDYFGLNSKDVIVSSTPLFLTRNNITTSVQEQMTFSKQLTGNTFSDLVIKDRPYDFKECKNLSFGKNHIYFIDSEYFVKNSITIFNNLESTLQCMLKTPNKKVSLESLQYADNLYKFLKNQRDTIAEQRLENLNQLLMKSSPPKDFAFPYIIIKKKAHLQTILNTNDISKDADTIPLDHGYLDSVKTRKAIMGVIEKWSPNLKTIVSQATHNSIPYNKNCTIIEEDVPL